MRFDTNLSVAKRVPLRATKINILSTKDFYLIPAPTQGLNRRSVSLVRLGAQSLQRAKKKKRLGPGPFPGTWFLLDVV